MIDNTTKDIKPASGCTLYYEALPADEKFYTVYLRAFDSVSLLSTTKAILINIANYPSDYLPYHHPQPNTPPTYIVINLSSIQELSATLSLVATLAAIDPSER